MILLKILFFLSLLVVFYAYAGYGILLWVLNGIKRRYRKKAPGKTGLAHLPPVSLIVPCYNEADFLQQKAENCLSLDYPPSLLNIIFITDGSTDHSAEVLKNYPSIKHMHLPERRGKIAAMNRSVAAADTPIIIFCDANTILNKQAIRNITRHYEDEKVGGVAGEKRISLETDGGMTGAGEGAYWKYESFLKKLDSEFYSVVGAAGELFSFRKELFENLGDNILLDDFIISLKIGMKGYRVIYEPDAYAVETASFSIAEERKRKIRISAGGFQSIVMLKGLLNIFKYPKLSFQYISHRVLRWAICPFLLPLILILNFILYDQTGGYFYLFMLLGQVIFYLTAAFAAIVKLRGTPPKLMMIPYYFVFMNISLYQGLFRYLNGNQTVLWEKAKRRTSIPL